MCSLSSIIELFFQNLPQQSSRKSMPILSRILLDSRMSSSISFFVLCSLFTADVDDETSELLSRPRWFNGEVSVSFGSDCGSVGILTTTDFPFWPIWSARGKKERNVIFRACLFDKTTSDVGSGEKENLLERERRIWARKNFLSAASPIKSISIMFGLICASCHQQPITRVIEEMFQQCPYIGWVKSH